MLTYVAVLAVVVVVLYGSYRALSGGEAVAPDDFRAVLRGYLEFVGARSEELTAALTSAPRDTPAPLSSRPTTDPLVETAIRARKRLTGYQQTLARIDVTPDAGDQDELESAKTLLAAAIEDLGWACRLIEAGTHRDNSGIRAAVDTLRDHADRCRAAAAPMLTGLDEEPPAPG